MYPRFGTTGVVASIELVENIEHSYVIGGVSMLFWECILFYLWCMEVTLCVWMIMVTIPCQYEWNVWCQFLEASLTLKSKKTKQNKKQTKNKQTKILVLRIHICILLARQKNSTVTIVNEGLG